MPETLRLICSSNSRQMRLRRTQHGQTLIIAIAVLFILLFIGGLFVARIASNLTASARGRDTSSAQALAEAGINYVATQLDNSEEAADWRPTPTAPLTSAVDPAGTTDPDYQWLQKGFTRVIVPGGRYLVRVVYNPNPTDARSQYLRIESVGRPGDIGTGQDPTVFVQNGLAPRLRVERVAYKQIGLTDYLRFVTGKNRSQQEAVLGIPSISRTAAMVLGDPTIAEGGNVKGVNNNEVLFGAPIRVNGNLNIMGDTFIYESPRGGGSGAANTPEGLLASGSIRFTPSRDVNNDNNLDETDHTVIVNQDVQTLQGSIPTLAIAPSTDPNFRTQGGFVRDGSSSPDPEGYTRGTPRLEPPTLDGYVNGSGISRYRALTRDSGKWVTGPNNARYNTGQFGYGTGIYINNPDDLQQETTRGGINGGYSLPRDWTNPNATFGTGFWNGPYYRPPGVLIELLGDRIRMTRNDNRTFLKPDGTPITQYGGRVLDIPLYDEDRTNPDGSVSVGRQNFVFPDGTSYALPSLDKAGDLPVNATTLAPDPAGSNIAFPNDAKSYGVNLNIFAEGNIRIRGVYGVNNSSATTLHIGRVHLNIVSGGTIYIEGNVVKGDLNRSSTCALMAHDYVCINTSMFTAPQNQNYAWERTTPDLDAFHTQIGLTNPVYDTAFSFGVDPSTYNTPPMLFVRHAAIGPSPSAINMTINPAFGANPTDPYYDFSAITGMNDAIVSVPYTYPLGLKYQGGGVFIEEGASKAPRFESTSFPLPGSVTTFVTAPGYDNIIRLQLDQTYQANPALGAGLGSGGTSDYMLSSAGVFPLDIRIEALLYAQEKSFFVIPGYGFNPDPDDTREGFVRRGGVRPSFSSADPGVARDNKHRFPFYGEPVDARITIFGAVAENYTASMGDQAKWMERWGWIPTYFGSTAPGAPLPNGATAPTAVQVPSDHLGVHDPANYVPGEDRNTDFRADVEKNPPETAGAANDFERKAITRGLRFVYDPAFAMPYQHPTDPTGSGPRHLRVKYVPALTSTIGGNMTTLLPAQRMPLPAIPRLPVCPGLLYSGNADRPLGE